MQEIKEPSFVSGGDNSRSVKNPTENIPTISFLAFIGFFFAELLRWIGLLVAFIRRYKILLAVFVVIGVAIGAVTYKMTPASYQLSMIVKPSELDGSVFGKMLKSLNDLAASGSSSELARNLKISEDMSQKIVKLTGENLQGSDLSKDTAKSSIGRPFVIQAVVTDNAVAEPLQDAIIHYFNSNTYLNKLKSDRVRLLAEKLRFINSELNKLDSLKLYYNGVLAMSKKPSMYYNNAMDPAKTYEASSNYFNEKNKIEEWLSQSKDVLTKIDSVKPAAGTYSLSMLEHLLLYGIAFFLLGSLIVLIRNASKSTK